ncbi:MAG: aminopeptidase P N-terminal domain-containing protein [Planctomycetota bacterium]|jgi:Xaa-Pro aminopeptidase
MRHPTIAFAIALSVSLSCLPSASAEEAPTSLTGIDLRKEHGARRAALADLTGLTESNGILVVHPGKDRGKDLLLLPPRNVRRESWVGPRHYPGKEAQKATGVARTDDVRKALEILGKELRGRKVVYISSRGASGERGRKLLGDLLGDAKSKLKVERLGVLTGPLRWKKSPEEIARIRRSAELAAIGHRRAIQATKPGMVEFEIQAVLEKACREGGAQRQAYDSIVGSGPNSCILHYTSNRRIMEDGDVLLMDAGGEFLGYACDVTRTWPVGEKFTEEQAKVYDVVLAAQAAGIKAAKKGATFRDISDACRKVINDAGYGKGWLHGPCHWVGMGVHDPNGRLPLEPGAVFVIEPGVYLPEKRFGVRIEDTFVMKEDGTLENLSRDVPKKRSEIEALRRRVPTGGR